MKKTIFLLIMTLLLAGGAAAQLGSKQVAKNALTIEPPVDTPVSNNFQGMESSGGTMDVLSNLYRGHSFVFLSDDRTNPISLTVTMDYGLIEAPGTYQVVSGQWTLVVFEDGNYVGTLFGDIPQGMIQEVANLESAGGVSQRTFKLNFRITGGMDRYENTEPEDDPHGGFQGTVDTKSSHAEGSLFNIL